MNTTIAIKSLRGKKLKTQQEMADILNVTRQTYNNYELNILKCDLELVLRILDALKCTEAEFQEFLNAFKNDGMSYLKIGG